MAYCAKADLSERFGDPELKQLTDESAGATISDAEVDAACSEAASEIDTSLSVRYSLPLPVVPAILKKWACDLARFFLWAERAGEGSTVRRNAEDAREALKQIATGKANLPDQPAESAPSASAFAVNERTQHMSDTTLARRPSLHPHRRWPSFPEDCA